MVIQIIPTIMKNNIEVPQKLKICIPEDSATSLLGIYPKEGKSAHLSLQYSSQQIRNYSGCPATND